MAAPSGRVRQSGTSASKEASAWRVVQSPRKELWDDSAAIPGAKLIIIQGTGHFALTEKPAEFNQDVLDFLNDK